MIRNLIFLLVFTACLLSLNVGAQQVSALKGETLRLSLEQAQNYAYEHNYDLLNSAYDVEIARKLVSQNTATGLPQINAGVDYMDYIKTPTTVIPNFLAANDTTGRAPKTLEMKFGMKYNLVAKVSATQLIYSGQYIVGLQTAKAFLETAKQRDTKNKVDVRQQVADFYYILLVNDQYLKILDSTYIVLTKQVIELQKNFENGLIEDIDVDQVKLMKSDLEAKRSNLRESLSYYNAYFKFLIGLKDNQEFELTDNLDFFLAQVDRDGLLAQPFDYKQNIEWTVLKKADYLTLMQYKLAKTAYHPTLAGFFSYSQNGYRNEWNFFDSKQLWFNTINWGLSLSIPIWSSGSRKFSVDQAKLNVEKTKVTDEKVRIGLNLQVETARNDFQNSYYVYQNKKKGFETALKIYTKTTAKYNEGLATSTDLLQKYSQFLTNNFDYMQSIYALLSSKSKLIKLLEKF